MTPCTHCRWKYPDHLLNPLMSTTGTIPDICGIYALAITNAEFGMKRKKFDGENAEELRLEAVEWRKKHPKDKPLVN